MGLLCGESCMILTSTIFYWSTRVTDGRTSGRTGNSMYYTSTTVVLNFLVLQFPPSDLQRLVFLHFPTVAHFWSSFFRFSIFGQPIIIFTSHQLICVDIMFLCMHVQRLQSYMDERHRYLQSWTFPDMSTSSAASTLEKLVDCLKTLYEQVTCWFFWLANFTFLGLLLQWSRPNKAIPSVHPSTKSSDLNEICYVDRGRWVMHDGMSCNLIQGHDQGHVSREI